MWEAGGYAVTDKENRHKLAVPASKGADVPALSRQVVPENALPLKDPLKVRVRGVVESERQNHEQNFQKVRTDMIHLRTAFDIKRYEHIGQGETQLALHLWQLSKAGGVSTRLRWRWRWKTKSGLTREVSALLPLQALLADSKHAQHKFVRTFFASVANTPLFVQVLEYEIARLNLNVQMRCCETSISELTTLGAAMQWRDEMLVHGIPHNPDQPELPGVTTHTGHNQGEEPNGQR